MTQQSLGAVLVGCYTVSGQSRFLPVTRTELDRAQEAFMGIIRSFNLGMGRLMLSISRTRDAAFVVPFERAAVACNLIVCNADDSVFEAGRVEAFLRRFDVAAVSGLSADILDGLENAGHDVDKLLAGRVVWARKDAYDRLANRPGIIVRRWIEVGPALAVECVEGDGAHIDAQEWGAVEKGGEIVLTSRLPRAQSFASEPTGLAGRIVSQPCCCGSADLRIQID